MIAFLLACQSNLEVGQYSTIIESIELYADITVTDSWFGQDICMTMYAPFIRTTGCETIRVTEKKDDMMWATMKVQTILGEATIPFRWQGQELFFPFGARIGEFDFSGEMKKRALEISEQKISELAQSFQKKEAEWKQGTFYLLQTGEYRGALELNAHQKTKVMIFDPLWSSHGAVEAEQIFDGSELVLAFSAEPNFTQEPAILRIHPFFYQAVVPLGKQPQKTELSYQLQAAVLQYQELEQQWKQQERRAKEKEQHWVEREGMLLLSSLSEKSSCEQWQPTKEQQLLWIGYDIDTEWLEHQCVLYVETERKQYRRYFSGIIRSVNE